MFIDKWRHKLYEKFTIIDKIIIDYNEEEQKLYRITRKNNKKKVKILSVIIETLIISLLVCCFLVSFINIIYILKEKVKDYQMTIGLLMIFTLTGVLLFLLWLPYKLFKYSKVSIFGINWELFIEELKKINYKNDIKAIFCSFIALILIILASHTLFILEKINSKINFCIIMVTLDIILINLINKIENKNFNLKKRYLKFLIFFLRLLYILLSVLPIIIFLIAEMAMSYKFLIIFPLLILNGIILEISKLEYKKKKKFLKCYFGIILSHLFIIIYSTGKISKSIIIYLKKNILVPNNSDISYSLIIIICAISVIFMINNFVINLKEYQDKKNNYRKSKIDILKLILKKNKVSVEVKNLEEILSRIKEIRGEYDIKINWKIIIPITLINAVILFKIQHWNLKSMSDILWSKKDNILQLIEETLVVYKGIIYFSVFIFILILFIYPIWLGISFFKENIHQNKYISREKMMELEDILKDMMLLKLNDKSDET